MDEQVRHAHRRDKWVTAEVWLMTWGRKQEQQPWNYRAKACTRAKENVSTQTMKRRYNYMLCSMGYHCCMSHRHIANR